MEGDVVNIKAPSQKECNHLYYLYYPLSKKLLIRRGEKEPKRNNEKSSAAINFSVIFLHRWYL